LLILIAFLYAFHGYAQNDNVAPIDLGSSGNTPKITNHYVIITGKLYDKVKKRYYYSFYEVGTSDPIKGKSSSNRLYIDDNNNLIEGKTAYVTVYSGNYYIITEVRKNIGQTY